MITTGYSPTRVLESVVIGGLSVASSLMLLAFIHHNLPLSTVVIAVACVGYGAFASNHWAITQTLAGAQMAGRWASVQNGVANPGSDVVAPWASGWIVQMKGSSRMAFVMAGAVALVGACSWGLLVRVEPVEWERI